MVYKVVLRHPRERGGVLGGVVMIFYMISKIIKFYNSFVNIIQNVLDGCVYNDRNKIIFNCI